MRFKSLRGANPKANFESWWKEPLRRLISLAGYLRVNGQDCEVQLCRNLSGLSTASCGPHATKLDFGAPAQRRFNSGKLHEGPSSSNTVKHVKRSNSDRVPAVSLRSTYTNGQPGTSAFARTRNRCSKPPHFRPLTSVCEDL
jgi:hypothetical protein